MPKRLKLPDPSIRPNSFDNDEDLNEDQDSDQKALKLGIPQSNLNEKIVVELLEKLRIDSIENKSQIATKPKTKAQADKPGPRTTRQKYMFELMLRGVSIDLIADAANVLPFQIRKLQNLWVGDGTLLKSAEVRRLGIRFNATSLAEKAQVRINRLLDSTDERIQLEASKLASTMYSNIEGLESKKESNNIDLMNTKNNSELIDLIRQYKTPERPTIFQMKNGSTKIPPQNPPLQIGQDEPDRLPSNQTVQPIIDVEVEIIPTGDLNGTRRIHI